MRRVIEAAQTVIRKTFETHVEAVNCHHNYVQQERHFGEDVFVTRKGAVQRASRASWASSPAAWARAATSCAAWATPRASKLQPRRRPRDEPHQGQEPLHRGRPPAATEGVECRKDEDVIDEIPMAYKDIDAVMAAQKDLVEVVHTLKQVVCVKG